jgi:hypothetical protein
LRSGSSAIGSFERSRDVSDGGGNVTERNGKQSPLQAGVQSNDGLTPPNGAAIDGTSSNALRSL